MSDEVREEPWWASGSPPEEGIDDGDPFERFTSARHGDGGAAVPPHEHAADGHVCHVCPVCVALRVLEDSRPEVVAHLSEALRHVSLAARAFIEAQVAATGGDDGLRRVDLDDE